VYIEFGAILLVRDSQSLSFFLKKGFYDHNAILAHGFGHLQKKESLIND